MTGALGTVHAGMVAFEMHFEYTGNTRRISENVAQNWLLQHLFLRGERGESRGIFAPVVEVCLRDRSEGTKAMPEPS